jgi:hypothetical protein
MSKRRFQFKIKGFLIAIALLAGPMLFLRPSATDDAWTIDFFGPVQVGKDGSFQVQGGSVRINQGDKQTEIRADRIVVQKDGTVEVDGAGTMIQTAR